MTDREAAWDAVHEAPSGGLDGGSADLRSGISVWSVTARSKVARRDKPPVQVTGTGPDETAALRALDDRLRGVPQPEGSRMAERERRFRLSYLAGAEESSRERFGRGLTEDELARQPGSALSVSSSSARRSPPCLGGCQA